MDRNKDREIIWSFESDKTLNQTFELYVASSDNIMYETNFFHKNRCVTL